MRSKTMTLMAAAVLFLPTIAHAQPSERRGIYPRDDFKNARDDVRANSEPAPDSSSSRNAAVVKVNAPGVTSWTFAVLTMWHVGSGRGTSARSTSSQSQIPPSAPPPTRQTVKREPYGMFTSKDDCEIARAKKIAALDERNSRQPHLVENAPVITTTVTVGNLSTTTQRPGGPLETMNVTDCAAENFSAGSSLTAQKN
jgi:hypothetical protein